MTRHGLTIGVERMDDQFIISIKASGKLTHQDYETMMPVFNGAFDQIDGRHVRVLFDLRELQGWDVRAAWDDLKLGVEHGSEFEKIALLGQSGWQELAAKIGNWFVSGEVVFFDDVQQAMNWLFEK